MQIHFCPLDKLCRSVGAPARLHITTKRYHYVIALMPSAKVQQMPHNLDKWVWFRRDSY